MIDKRAFLEAAESLTWNGESWEVRRPGSNEAFREMYGERIEQIAMDYETAKRGGHGKEVRETAYSMVRLADLPIDDAGQLYSMLDVVFRKVDALED